jgi:hypothetical protein
MPIDPKSIQLGHCYVADRVVYKVTDVQREMVTYVIRDQLSFPKEATRFPLSFACFVRRTHSQYDSLAY